jgi:succinate dehydrogenase hydrophobic anchor subunit
MIHSFTIANISYHSYVSCSSVISDYIKHNRIELLSRTVNIKSHTIALIGFMWTIWSYNSQYND